ncbi:MAG: cobalamin adenosyltransferase [Spirochaetes bacterium]|nr:cobalamin adenosyltransferase [Spirochaetota bacterium]
MEVVDENMVRQIHLIGKQDEIRVNQRDYVTQSARDYIREKNLSLVIDDDENKFIRPSLELAAGKYVSESGEREYDEKPEYMTHLYGNVLVMKNHPRIILRGKLDSFIASIMEMQIFAEKKKIIKLKNDINEILLFAQQILKCEVKNQPFEEKKLLNYSEEELREISHNPEKYFGRGHIKISPTHGEVEIKLNLLRTQARELEIAAVTAFCSNEGQQCEGKDLLKALNRLSSAIYILMLRNSCKQYQSG